LAKKVRESKLGVRIGQSLLSLLLFAGDIVLIAEDRKQLQKLLDIVFEYSIKWRFKFNIDKSKIVVFSKKLIKTLRHYYLGIQELEVVDSYKYLGVDLMRSLSWKVVSNRLAMKARSRVAIVSKAMSEGLSVEAGERLWVALIRPVLEYGVEVVGALGWKQSLFKMKWEGDY